MLQCIIHFSNWLLFFTKSCYIFNMPFWAPFSLLIYMFLFNMSNMYYINVRQFSAANRCKPLSLHTHTQTNIHAHTHTCRCTLVQWTGGGRGTYVVKMRQNRLASSIIICWDSVTEMVWNRWRVRCRSFWTHTHTLYTLYRHRHTHITLYTHAHMKKNFPNILEKVSFSFLTWAHFCRFY